MTDLNMRSKHVTKGMTMQEKKWFQSGAMLQAWVVCLFVGGCNVHEHNLPDVEGGTVDATDTDGGSGDGLPDVGSVAETGIPEQVDLEQCGDGQVQDGEECDPLGFSGTCAPFGMWGGFTTCNAETCTLNKDGCDPECALGEPWCYCRFECNDDAFMCVEVLPDHATVCIPQQGC